MPLACPCLELGAQPLSLHDMGVAPCPLVVSADQADTQPLRLHPSQVALKNSLSCLSPADAIYAPNGCPIRLCSYPSNLDLPVQPPRP